MRGFNGVKVSQMLFKVVKILEKATNDSNSDLETEVEMTDSDPEEMGSDSEDENHGELLWSTRPPQLKSNATAGSYSVRAGDRSSMLALNSRIRKDLRAAKNAGFRVGHLGALLNHGQTAFITISCRIAKLNI